MIAEIKCAHCGRIFEDEILEKNALCPHCGKVTPVMPATPAAKPTQAIQFSPSGYVHKNLMPGEVVTGTALLHWRFPFRNLDAMKTPGAGTILFREGS
jgi:DNA-directed RNA polymerase subunit RPC12/RpoP